MATPKFRTATVIAVLISLGAVLGILLLDGNSIVDRDAISYWSAGRLLLRHQNPYDAVTVLRLERTAAFKKPDPLVMRNPPWALFLALPLGLLNAPLAGTLWTILNVACILASVAMLWKMIGNPDEPVPLFAFFFAPCLACIGLGQSSAVILLGITCFLRWHTTRPFLAGVSLLLAACKPHILLPFFLVVLLWALFNRVNRLLAGVFTSLTVSVAVAFWFDHSILADYLPTLGAARNSVTASISSLLRATVNPHMVWLQYVPVLSAGVWATWYLLKHRVMWDWKRDGLVLLVVSVWVAPYNFMFDEVVVLPAILAVIWLKSERDKFVTVLWILNVGALATLVFDFPVGWAYRWTTTAWLGWYLFARRQASVTQSHQDETHLYQEGRAAFLS